jgi:hypothetical protein
VVDVEAVILEELDRLAPAEGGGDWDDVHRRVAASPDEQLKDPAGGLVRRIRQRPLLALLILVIAALVPVGALGVAKSDPWWFLRFDQPRGFGPAKGSEVVVVRQGAWGGHGWVLTAYRSSLDHLCFQLTEKTASGQASGQGGGTCGPVPGTFGRRARGSRLRLVTISYLGGSGFSASAAGQIRYLVGPVVSSASEVVITLANGTVVRTPTFGAPAALGLPIRFYATQLPTASSSAGTHPTCRQQALQFVGSRPRKLVGLDSSGRTVAQFEAPQSARMIAGFARARCGPYRNNFVIPPNLPAAGRKLTTVARITGPYRATATIAINGTFPITSYTGFPISPKTRVVQQSRCWRVSFSNGQSQGACTPLAKRYEPELSPQLQYAGRDTFVIVQAPPRTGPAIVRVALLLANGQVLSTKPIDGIVVFAIPRNALSVNKSQRGFLTGYDESGGQVSFYNGFAHVRYVRQPVYYRSCPPASHCYPG